MNPPNLKDDKVRHRIHHSAELLVEIASANGDTPEEALTMLAAAAAVMSITLGVSMQIVGDLIAGYRKGFAAMLPMTEVGKS